MLHGHVGAGASCHENGPSILRILLGIEGDGLVGIAQTVFLDGLVGLGKTGFSHFHLSHELAWSKILACRRCPQAVGVVMPVADVDDIDHLGEFGVLEYGILRILGATEGHHGAASRLLLPLGHGLQPETGEVQWTGIFFAQQLHHIVTVFELLQALADVLSVQGAQHGVIDIVELLCHEHPLVAGIGHRLGERRGVDIVHRSPRTIYPMGTGLDDVVLEIVFAEKQYAFLCS